VGRATVYTRTVRSQILDQLSRHEAQLYEWLHAFSKLAVIDLIDIGEVVDGLPLLVFVIDSDFIVKDCVKKRTYWKSVIFFVARRLSL
jgi:hypothetical protein